MRGDLDILFPQGPERLGWLSRLREALGRLRPALRKGLPSSRAPHPGASRIAAADLWAAFEYLVGEYEACGAIRDDLVDVLTAWFDRQTGQARFDLQRRLAGVLADRAVARFHVGLRMAARVPVPQARMVLLEMLTLPEIARWSPRPAAGNRNGQHGEGHDLRPVVVAALGQLRDPSLLGLLHRLLEKLSVQPDGHENLLAAVQWSLMNLAPGGQGEPVPASILATVPPQGPEQAGTPVASIPDGGDASTAEAMRVVSALRGGRMSEPTGRASSVPVDNPQAAEPQDPPRGASERDELLSGF